MMKADGVTNRRQGRGGGSSCGPVLRRLAIGVFSGVSALVALDMWLEDPWTRVGPVRSVLPSLGELGLAAGDSLFLVWVIAAAATLALIWLRPAARWRRCHWLQLGLRVIVTLAIVSIVALWLLLVGLRSVG